MRTVFFASAAALGAWAWLPAQTAPAEDIVLRAMRDEVQRSKKLSLASLENPYFVQYMISDADSFTVNATLGALTNRRRGQFRLPEIQVRVGDYKFDNTNYVGSGFNFAGRYDVERLPLENSYALLRRFLWLGTDSAYKSAVEAISRKRAALRNLTVSDQIADFARAEPVKLMRDLRKSNIDEELWASRVRSLSGIFDRYPDVRNSAVDLEAGYGGFYLANSEGTEMRIGEGVSYLRVRASGQAADGMTVRDSAVWHAFDWTRLPLEPELRRGITTVAENVAALTRAPRGEDYSGPVLFDGIAASQILAEVLGRNLALTRRPVMEPGRPGGIPTSELEGRQGARILPDFISVVDDPTQQEWRGRPLFGSYEVDREGVPARRLQLVEKGVLKAFLLTRQPMRGFEGSNGHARLPGAFGAQAASISNLFVSASDPVPPSELKKRMLQMIGQRNKPYGIIVRKMDFPSSASFEEARRLLSGGQSAATRPVSMPVLIYRIYPDGREELVRGLRFRSFNARTLKDILAAGNDSNVFEYLENLAPFALMGGANYAAESCVIAPSLLIDDVELHQPQEEMPKLPVAPPPDLAP